MEYFAGFQPCDFAALELPFLIVPIGIGFLFLFLSRKYPSTLNINKTSLLIASTVILTFLVPIELYLFNAERFNIGHERVASVHGNLWLAVILMWPIVCLICRYIIKDLQKGGLINLRKWCLIISGIACILVGLSFGIASSCYGVG